MRNVKVEECVIFDSFNKSEKRDWSVSFIILRAFSLLQKAM